MSAPPSGRHSLGGSAELRCSCHRLLARIEGRGLVLKCPRCKKGAVVSLSDLSATQEVEFIFL
jgi:phage FluMu protein Com